MRHIMYSEWISQTESIQSGVIVPNVLQSFPAVVGRNVVSSIVVPLTSSLHPPRPAAAGGGEGGGEGGGDEYRGGPVLATPEQVQWAMQVVGYGLSLPLSEHPLIIACIQVYENWLTALSVPRAGIPHPVLADPGHYSRIIFDHFCQLFIPRGASNRDEAGFETHLALCRKVLQITHAIIMTPAVRLSRETWNSLFHYLLHIADNLLAPPLETQSLGAHLCDLIVHILFEAWLRASSECFPDPSLWKSLRELCGHWRHHPSVVEQWNKLMYILTTAVITHLYSPRHLAALGLAEGDQDTDFKQLLQFMSNDALVQCWFRMLHTLGNPTELAYPQKIASAPSFRKAAISLPEVNRSPPHPCLEQLPGIFLEAMRGVACLVYLFLGQEPLPIRPPRTASSSSTSTQVGGGGGRPSPSLHHKGSKENKGGGVVGGVVTSKGVPIGHECIAWFLELEWLFLLYKYMYKCGQV